MSSNVTEAIVSTSEGLNTAVRILIITFLFIVVVIFVGSTFIKIMERRHRVVGRGVGGVSRFFKGNYKVAKNILIGILRYLKGDKCSICLKHSRQIRVYKGAKYCDSCAREKFFICDVCDNIVDKIEEVDGSKICPICFKNNTHVCIDCNERFLDENMYAYRYSNDILNTSTIKGFLCTKCAKKRYKPFKVIRFKNLKVKEGSFIKNKFKRYCGVEIECENYNRDMNCFTRNELKSLKFSQIRDGSLCDGKGVEFYSRPMVGDTLFEYVSNFCKKLNNRDYYVDKHCGLHIHLEVNKRLDMLKKIYLFYLKFEPLFFKMLPKSRQNKRYCEKFSAYYKDSIDDIMNAKTLCEFKEMIYETRFYKSKERDHGYVKRYCWANLHSIFYRGTLEIRSHSGTINSNKIINWFLIHLRILEFLEKESLESIRNMKVTDDNLLNIFDPSIRKYISSRWKLFPESNVEEEELNLTRPSYWLNSNMSRNLGKQRITNKQKKLIKKKIK